MGGPVVDDRLRVLEAILADVRRLNDRFEAMRADVRCGIGDRLAGLTHLTVDGFADLMRGQADLNDRLDDVNRRLDEAVDARDDA